MIMRSLGCGAAVVVAGLALVADVAQAQSNTFAVPPGVTISAGGFSTHWIKIHAWLMWIGMGFLMPLAIILVRFSKRARERGDLETVRKLVYAHEFIQICAVCAVIASASVAFTKFDNKFAHTHERLGLSLWICVWIAPLLGIFRPKHGAKIRTAWYAAHWIFGTGAVVLGFINIFIGMYLYEQITSKNIKGLNVAFATQIGIMGLIYMSQDRWQYLVEQGNVSRTVDPLPYNNSTQKTKGGNVENDHHHVSSVV